MATQSFITRASAFQSTPAVLLARAKNPGGTLFDTSNVSSVEVKVYDLDDNNTEVHSETPTVSTVIYDSLQTDDRWDEDDTGYNVAYTVPATALSAADNEYQVEIIITSTAIEDTAIIFNVLTQARFSA